LLHPVAINLNSKLTHFSPLEEKFESFHLSFEVQDFKAFFYKLDKVRLLIHVQDNFVLFKLCEVKHIVDEKEHKAAAVDSDGEVVQGLRGHEGAKLEEVEGLVDCVQWISELMGCRSERKGFEVVLVLLFLDLKPLRHISEASHDKVALSNLDSLNEHLYSLSNCIFPICIIFY
jgi:hypothetical protein